MLKNNSLSFITNNFKQRQLSRKRLKVTQYFENKVGLSGGLFSE